MPRYLILHSTNSDSLHYPSKTWGPLNVIHSLVDDSANKDPVYVPVAWVEGDDLEHAWVSSQNLDEHGWLHFLPEKDISPSRRADRRARSTCVGDVIFEEVGRVTHGDVLFVDGEANVVLTSGFEYVVGVKIFSKKE